MFTKIYSVTIYYKDKKSQKKPKHKVKIWSTNKDDIYDLVDKITHNQTTDLGIDNDLITYFVLGKDYLYNQFTRCFIGKGVKYE